MYAFICKYHISISTETYNITVIHSYLTCDIVYCIVKRDNNVLHALIIK